MKKLFQAIILAALALSSSAAFGEHHEGHDKVLRHVVCLKFTEVTSQEKITDFMKLVDELPAKITEIKDLEWGVNVSEEGNDKGFTHCITFTFADQKALEAYLPHKDHVAIVEVLKPMLADVFVVDYWTK